MPFTHPFSFCHPPPPPIALERSAPLSPTPSLFLLLSYTLSQPTKAPFWPSFSTLPCMAHQTDKLFCNPETKQKNHQRNAIKEKLIYSDLYHRIPTFCSIYVGHRKAISFLQALSTNTSPLYFSKTSHFHLWVVMAKRSIQTSM